MGAGSLPIGGSHRINVGDEGGNWAQNTASSHTGTTTETQLARILIPGGYLGPQWRDGHSHDLHQQQFRW